MRLILGAGCAGLALARALIDHEVDEPVVMLDRRSAFANDRTWCFWQTDPSVPRSENAEWGWKSWEFVGSDGRRVRHTSLRHPYLMVSAETYHRRSLQAINASDHIDLRLGERVLGVRPRPDSRVEVTTSGGSIVADHVVDAMGGAGPLPGRGRPGAIELRQSFLGVEVVADRPVFDPTTATLMDFRTTIAPRHDDGLHFIYVLPLSQRRALVEHTTFGPSAVPPAVRRRAIGAYLAEHWSLDRWTTAREERGTLPMTTRRFPLRHGEGISTLGAAAGAIRPSTGYAFVRIQRHAEAVATAIATGTELPARLAHPRRVLLDELFLRALAVEPRAFETVLLDLAAHTDGDRFARFMSDASTPADELAVIRAMARPAFLLPMATSSVRRPIVESDRPTPRAPRSVRGRGRGEHVA